MYSIFSIYTAGYLVAKGFNIIGTEDENGRLKFCFTESEELYEELRNYRNDKFLKDYIDSINKVKDIMFAQKNN